MTVDVGHKGKSDFFLHNTIILYAIGAVAALLRIGIRCFLMRRPGLEEYMMIFALLCWTGDTFLITVTVEKGTNQVPTELRSTMSAHDIHEREIGSKAFLSAWFLYVTAIWTCKAAILIFYKRLTERVNSQMVNTAASGVLIATYIASMLSVALVCRPFSGYWTVHPDPGPACTEGLHFVWIVGVLNIITDVMLLAMPIPILIYLQATLIRKILLGGLFFLGLFVIIATILRIYFTISSDDISNMTFWSMIETSTLFIVSNAPGIRSIFTRRMKKTHSSGDGTSRAYELTGSNIGGAHKSHQATITTNIKNSAGDSQEWIMEQPNPMVIHQSMTYDVMVEPNPQPPSPNGPAIGPQHSVNVAATQP